MKLEFGEKRRKQVGRAVNGDLVDGGEAIK